MGRPRKEKEEGNGKKAAQNVASCLAVVGEMIDSLVEHYVDEFGNEHLLVIKKLKALKESIGE